MPYVYYFDWCGFPARVTFDDECKKVVLSEVWDWKNQKLVPDKTMNFTYGLLHIDRDRGIKDDDYVISEEEFNALVEKRTRQDSARVPVRVHWNPDHWNPDDKK